MEKYFVFGKRATDALWNDENDLDSVVEAINDLEADLFIYHPETTPIHDVLKAYSRWTDYAYLSREQYDEITSRL